MHAHHHQHHRRGLLDDAKSFVNEHNPFQKKTPGTIYKTVYKTLDPTFTGEVAGYTTIGKEDDEKTTTTNKGRTTTTKTSKTTTRTATKDDDETTSLPSSITDAASSKSLPTTLATKTTSTEETLLKQETSTGSLLPSASSESSTESSSGSGSSGAAKAGIAIGVLAAVLLVFVAVWFLIKKRRRQAEEGRQHLDDDEKINGPFHDRPVSPVSVNTTRTAPNAPRLSLRPVTQFLPNLEKRGSKGAGVMLGATGAAGAASAQNAQAAPVSPIRSPGQSAWERPMTSDSNHVDNPFGNHAERLQTPTTDQNPSVTASNGQNSATANANITPAPGSPPMTASTPTAPGSPESAVVGVAGTSAVVVANGAAVASNLTRKESMKKNGPKALDLTVAAPPTMGTIPASPATTEFSVNSVPTSQQSAPSQGAAAIAAAGGPNNSTVHRVQLDFAPTLEDEMELKAGQLVRLLHEYDDGWALCIRLDRSQQGVVPRTCLSARPVKPRPQPGAQRNGPPVNPSGPGMRGPGPQGRPGPHGPPGPHGEPRPMSPAGHPRPMSPAGHPRPMSPAGQQRPMSPAGGPGSRPQSPAGRPMQPYRPQSPAGGRPQSPAGRSQSPGPRARSPSGAARRNNPPGPSPMNPNANSPPQQTAIERKPVPGQAY